MQQQPMAVSTRTSTRTSSSSLSRPVHYSPLTSLGIVCASQPGRTGLRAKLEGGAKACADYVSGTPGQHCRDPREEAFSEMLEEATQLGANGVVELHDRDDSPGRISGLAVSDKDGSGIGGMDGWTCTSEDIPAHRIVLYSLGVVTGLTVRTNQIAPSGICAAKQQASRRMISAALERGADGILAVRYDQNEISDGVIEVIAYGTAVTTADIGCLSEGTTSATSGGSSVVLPKAMVTTSSPCPEAKEHSLGLVQGISVCMSSLPCAITGGYKGLMGGEIKAWTNLCADSRENAYNVMVEDACRKGAKGVVAVRYTCNQVGKGIVEVIVCGTAVADVPLGDEMRRDGLKSGVADVPQSIVRTVQSARCSL